MKFKILAIIILAAQIVTAQSNRVKQLVDRTGVYVSGIAPADTSLTWRNTADGNSYFWDVGAQSWNIVQLNYEVDSVGQIALNSYPTGAMIQSKGYRQIGDGGSAIYYVYDSKTGYENEDTLGAVFQTANAKFAIMDTNYPLNVLSFGVNRTAETDGTNDTEAMQRIFDYCAKTIWHDVIYVPRAFVDLNATIRWDGTLDDRGVTIKGDAPSSSSAYGSSFVFRGALSSNDTMFYFEKIGDLFVNDIDFNGNNRAKIAVHIAPLSNNIRFDRFSMAGMVKNDGTYTAGIDTEMITGDQVSELYISNGKINSCDYGIKGGNANNKNYYIEGMSFQQNVNPVYVNKSDNLSVYKCTFANNTVAITCNDCSATSIISNELEGDSMLFYSGANSAIEKSHNLMGNYIALKTGAKIAVKGDGGLNLIGNHFFQGDGGAVQIKWGNNVGDAIFSVNNFFNNAQWTPSDLTVFPYLNNNGTAIVNTNLISKQNKGGSGGSDTFLRDYTQNTKTITEFKYYDNIVYTANNINNDTFKISGIFQTQNTQLLGTTGTFVWNHKGEQSIWYDDLIEFNGKHLASGFGVWIRGQEYVKGIDESSPGLASSGGLGVYNNSIEAITITSSGNTGIGGIVPTEKLQVNGNCVVSGTIYLNTAKTVGIFTGTGDPEGAVTASVGSTFHRTDGGASTSFYVKESGAGNTGWVAK